MDRLREKDSLPSRGVVAREGIVSCEVVAEEQGRKGGVDGTRVGERQAWPGTHLGKLFFLPVRTLRGSEAFTEDLLRTLRKG